MISRRASSQEQTARIVSRSGFGAPGCAGSDAGHTTTETAPGTASSGVRGENSRSASARTIPAPGVASASSRKSDSVTARSWRRNSSGMRRTASGSASGSAPPVHGSGLATFTPPTPRTTEIAPGPTLPLEPPPYR